MERVANSTPIVDLDSKLNSFLVNLLSRLLLPTPESPIKTTANTKQRKLKTLVDKHRKKCLKANHLIFF